MCHYATTASLFQPLKRMSGPCGEVTYRNNADVSKWRVLLSNRWLPIWVTSKNVSLRNEYIRKWIIWENDFLNGIITEVLKFTKWPFEVMPLSKKTLTLNLMVFFYLRRSWQNNLHLQKLHSWVKPGIGAGCWNKLRYKN